jgi:uncharacterized protein YndB with AHSA1/START domain
MPKKSATRSITLEVELDAPRDAVWRALTSPEELARWFPPVSQGGSTPGDTLLLSWGEDMQWTTTIAAVEPETHVRWCDDPVAYEKMQSGESDKPTLVVDWHLETRRKTIVRLVHSGLGNRAVGRQLQRDGRRVAVLLLQSQAVPRATWHSACHGFRRRKSPSRARHFGRASLVTGWRRHGSRRSAAPRSPRRRTTSVVVELANPPGHLWLRFPLSTTR